MLDKLLNWFGLTRNKTAAAWLTSQGGTFYGIAARLKALEEFGGAWSYTFTVNDEGLAEAHLLQVAVAPAVWRGPGFRKPKKGKEEAQVMRKAIFHGQPWEFAAWLDNVRAEIAADQEKVKKAVDGLDKGLTVVEGGKGEEGSK